MGALSTRTVRYACLLDAIERKDVVKDEDFSESLQAAVQYVLYLLLAGDFDSLHGGHGTT